MATQTELYRFSERSTGTIWTYTSGNDPITYLTETYAPASISRSEAQLKTEIARANIDIKLSLINNLGVRCLETNGEEIVTATIFEQDRAGAYSTIWKGRLASIQPGVSDVTLRMESIFTSLRRYGLRAKYQRSCRHPLYSPGCGVDPEDYAVAGNISARTGNVLTIVEADAFSDGYFVGGMVRAPDMSLSFVIGHAGNQITLQRLSRSLYSEIVAALPVVVTLYPGCDLSLATCWSKFNNGLRYGGFKWIPSKNPMGGSSIV